MSTKTIINSSPWLSCDHTFRSITNIGTTRQSDDRWIKQYQGLFCILNANGQVVTWKLTKGLAVNDVEDVLIALKTRLQQHGCQLE